MPKPPSAESRSVDRSYGGQGQAERVEARRLRFLNAAIEQFGTVGYRASTVRSITAAAGLSNRYFYESFGSMEDLLMACYEHVTSTYRDEVMRALDSSEGSVEQRIRLGVKRFLEQMRNPLFARITQVEVLGVSAQVDALYVRSIREFGDLIVRNIAPSDRVLGAKERRRHAILGAALAGAMSTAGAMWMRSHYRDDIGLVVDAAVDVLLGAAGQMKEAG